MKASASPNSRICLSLPRIHLPSDRELTELKDDAISETSDNDKTVTGVSFDDMSSIFSNDKSDIKPTVIQPSPSPLCMSTRLYYDDLRKYTTKIMRKMNAASRISYEDLEEMKMIPIDKQLLVDAKSLSKWSSMYKKDVKARTDIPAIVKYLIIGLRLRHDWELYKNKSFLFGTLEFPLYVSPHLNRLFSAIYTFREHLGKMDFLTNRSSAADFFVLIIIFLRRLPEELFPISYEFTKILFNDINVLSPLMRSLYDKSLAMFREVVSQVDVNSNNWVKDIHEMSKITFRTDFMANDSTAFNKKIHNCLQECIMDIYPEIRRNIMRFILRNIIYEVNRSANKAFYQMRHGLPASDDNQNKLFDSKIKIIERVSATVGPHFLKLPYGFDSKTNRIKAMTRILWYVSASSLLHQESTSAGTIICHENCLCGFGGDA